MRNVYKGLWLLMLFVVVGMFSSIIVFADSFSRVDTVVLNVTKNATVGVGSNGFVVNGSSGNVWMLGRINQSLTGTINRLGLTYMGGAKIRSIGGNGYYTLGATASVGSLYFENAVDHSGKIVKMEFNLSDESIHIQNPLLIDTSGLGLDPDDPIIEITDGTTTATFSAEEMSIGSMNISDVISGSPTITYDTINSSSGNFIEVGDSTRIGGLTGSAYISDTINCGSLNQIKGVGTIFTQEVQIGEIITVKGQNFTIFEIINDDSLTVYETLFEIDCTPESLNLGTAENQFIITNEGLFASNFKSNKTDTFSLGRDYNRWKEGHFETLYAEYIETFLPTDSTTNIGSLSERFVNIYGRSLNSHINFCLGSPSECIFSWDDVNQSIISLWINDSGTTTNKANLLSYDEYLPTWGSSITSTGTGSATFGYSGCGYEPLDQEFLCAFVPTATGHIKNIGKGTIAGGFAGDTSGNSTLIVDGYGNMGGGITTDGDSVVNGTGNFYWGTGNSQITGTGNLVSGDGHNVAGNSGIIAGTQHTTTTGTNGVTLLGAQNSGSASYVTGIGFGIDLSGATAVGIGRNIQVSGIYSAGIGQEIDVSGRDSYALGQGINITEDDVVVVGVNSNDIKINDTTIEINKFTDFNDTSLINTPHLEVYNVTMNGYTLTISAIDTWYNFTGLQQGEIQDFTLTNDGMIPDYSGTYKVDYAVSFSGSGGSTHAISLEVNGAEHEPCRIYRELGTSGDVGNAGGSCIISLVTGDKVTGAVMDVNAPAQNINVWSMNANIIRIGD